MGGDGSRIRRAAAVLLALIAGVSLVIGAASVAARQTLYDPSSVEDVSSRLLDEPAVRSEIAGTLTTRLRSLDPALKDPVVSGGLERLAAAVTSTDPFRRAFSDAVARLQTDLLAAGLPRVALRLDGMLTETLAALQERAGTTLQIPQQDVGGVLVVDPDQVEAYRRLNDVTRQTGWPAIAIGALAALGAVLVAQRRRAAIFGVGATVAVVALLALGSLILAKSAAAARADDPTSRDAVDAVWDVVARDVRTALTAVLLAGLGAAVAGLALQAFRGGRASS
jgi:hypothetical protein